MTAGRRKAALLACFAFAAKPVAAADEFRMKFCEEAVNAANIVQSARQRAEGASGAAQDLFRNQAFWLDQVEEQSGLLWTESRPLTQDQARQIVELAFSFPIGANAEERQRIRTLTFDAARDLCLTWP